MKILVTSVGGGCGQSIMKALDSSDYNIVAVDGGSLSAGLYTSRKSYLVPLANEDNYIPELLKICQKENISLLFPGSDPELTPLSLNSQIFKEIGTTVIVSRPEVINITEDKKLTFDHLTNAGINMPYTTLADKFSPNEKSFPFILKQKVGGSRSKNVFLIRNHFEWQTSLERIGDGITNFIVMDYIEGDEYTCGTINLNDSCKGIIVMRRTLRDGDTYKCFVARNDVIEAEVRQVVETIKPFGACNVQLRLRDGKPYVFEINARCSGTTAARALSGFNEPKMIADYLLKGIEPNYTIREQTILRYWKELVVNNDRILTLENKKVIENNTDILRL